MNGRRLERLEKHIRPETRGKALTVYVMSKDPGNIPEGDSVGVVSEEAKAATERIIAGERTGEGRTK